MLILGAGVNGAALARELLLNGIPVRVVDAFDLAGGATAKSSRLIHGGLRYLEYGDFRLVRESLEERSRLRKLAPHLVKPLRLAIPMRRRVGGMIASAVRFFGLNRNELLRRLPIPFRNSGERGMWLVRVGLWLYDRFVSDPEFPQHRVRETSESVPPRVNRGEYRWICVYTDGQMLYPERFVVALLTDAREIADERGLEFRVDTYRQVKLDGTFAEIVDPGGAVAERFEPSAVVNATGAWGDRTLAAIGVPARRLFGGTKGSHFLTSQPALREALGDTGVYAEADDGRLVFVLPFGGRVMVGTTDERFELPPEAAVAAEEEIEYLLELVNDLFPAAGLSRADVDMHYSGVRPLPYNPDGKAAAISRDHRVEIHEGTALPAFTLVGGKLTTARAFGELAADTVCKTLGIAYEPATRDRPVPGGENHPADETAERDRLARESGLPPEQVERLWQLFGSRTAALLRDADTSAGGMLNETAIPADVVRRVIETEWVTTLGDLIERRLMLLFDPQLSRATLRHLAELLAADGCVRPNEIENIVQGTIERIAAVYGKQID